LVRGVNKKLSEMELSDGDPMKSHFLLEMIALVFVLAGCRAARNPGALNLPDLAEENGKTWLETDPVQCAGNPWEKWARSDASIPIECSSNCKDGDARQNGDCRDKCIVQKYYSGKGIQVFDVKYASYEEKFGRVIPICEACDCAGGTMYVQVADAQADEMEALGYGPVVRVCDAAMSQQYGCDMR
jgi:hypothetical protein